MKNILVVGAGRSAGVLIDYLINHGEEYNWHVTVGDYNIEVARTSICNSKNASAIFFNVNNHEQRKLEIEKSDIVISMLPASMHLLIAEDCVKFQKDLITASYVSNEINNLDHDAKKAGVLLLNEIGLDPGIDHMSAMNMINKIKEKGGKITSFKSFCGGLVHPDYDNNPWHYKFTWNPRNVVLAGQGISRYIEKGEVKEVPYKELFSKTKNVSFLDVGCFEGYPNRDSIKYKELYQLNDIQTLFRGTLRQEGYSKSWNTFIKLGLTDDTYIIEDSENLTYKDYINIFLFEDNQLSIEERFCKQLGIELDSKEFQKFKWLDIFDHKKIDIQDATPAQILQEILERKLFLNKGDKDMILMQNQVEFDLYGKKERLFSSLVVYGEDYKNTAMAKTVGLPMGIAAKLILNNEVSLKGVHIPISKQIYEKVLMELKNFGIQFIDQDG